MEACEGEIVNISTSTEENNADSFNSSELDEAMNELMTQDVQELEDDALHTNEEHLLDVDSKAGNGNLKLQLYAANKVLRRARNLKRNYNFSNRTSSNNTSHISVEEGASSRSLLNVKAADSFKKLDEKTSLKINNIIKYGHLTVQKNNRSGPKIINKTSLKRVPAPESFPKAIFYPNINKLNSQPSKTEHDTKMSFNEVFTKQTEKRSQYYANVNEDSCPKNRVSKQNQKRNIATSDPTKNQKNVNEPVKYLIPQNMIATQSDRVSTSSNQSTSESQNSSISLEDNSDITNSGIPERPQINYDLIDALADYRVIARYLFSKLNIPPIDFEGTDDYINLYKLSRN